MKKLFLTAAFLSALSFHANAATLTQSFNVRIGFFDAAKVNVSYTLGTNYAFASEIQTSGMFDTFYSFRAHYNTSGVLRNKAFITKKYTQNTKSSAHMRTKSLIFNQGGILEKRLSSKDNDERSVDVILPASMPDAYDIQTVLLMMLSNLQNNNTCALTKTVFNSKKTYHISIEDEGTLSYKNKKTPFKGLARKCHAFIHQEKTEKGDLLWQVSAERSIVFYLMQDHKTGLYFVPEVNISSTPLGDLNAYATNYQIKD